MRTRSKAGLVLIALLLVMSVVACAPKKVAVPDLSGQTVEQADAALAAAKLVKGEASSDYSGDTPMDSVFKQTPAAGTQVDEGSAVNYVVSKGEPPPPQVAVPDVNGLNEAKATEAIEAAGLSILPYDEFHAAAKKGTAFGQLPAANAQTDEGSHVFVAFSLGKRPTVQIVPDVTGRSEKVARARLIKDGFRVKTSALHVIGVKKGEIVAQVPAARYRANPGTTVFIMVASGSPAGKVPDVSNLRLHKATNELIAAGFAPTIFYSASPSVPKGTVMGQVPIGGKEEQHGTEIGVVISAGDIASAAPDDSASGPMQAPDVVNLKKADASKAMKAAGLVPQFIEAHDPKVKAGSIIRQVPAAGEPVRDGQDVVLSLSVGPTSKFEVKVPSVANKTRSAAQSTMTKAGLRYRIHWRWSTKVAKGRVIGQLPSPGAKVLRNARVGIVLSLGKPPALSVTVPDVAAQTEEAAKAALEKLGLEVEISEVYGAEGQPPGTVAEQYPPAGSKEGADAKVILVIVR